MTRVGILAIQGDVDAHAAALAAVGAEARPVLRSLRSRIDPREYNGATLLGLKGIVVKSHGSADVVAFKRAIDVALAETNKNVPQQIGRIALPNVRHKEAV